MAKQYRRIVTGHDAQGKSIIVSDGPAPGGFDEHGGGLAEFWITDQSPVDNKTPKGDPANLPRKLEPPHNGSIMRFFALPPDSLFTPQELEQHAKKLFASIGATHCQVDTSRHPAMHRTKTIDYIILLEGEVKLIVDKAETLLKPFDVVIQRGTNHAWSNPGKQAALLVAVLVDAEPAP
ncbi:MAG: cupin domain-containing protein [Candidatus Binataceae bacterium]|nr:cupin domain-containing protein [Candidatus Binataceae bacterium]